MSHTTQSASQSQAQSPTLTPEAVQELRANAAAVAGNAFPWWTQATECQREYVLDDMLGAYASDGLPFTVYVEEPCDLDGHMGCVYDQREQDGRPFTPEAAAHYARLKAQAEAAVPKQEADAETPEQQLAAGVAEQEAAKAAEQAAKATALKEADKLLDQAVTAHTRAEHSLLTGMLETGRLLHEYVLRRMSAPLFHPREAAIKGAVGELAKCSSNVPDAGYVNNLILCHHAHRLLAVGGLAETVLGKGKRAKPAVPYGHYKDHWTQLVNRVNKDTPEETYVLLPGMEDRCIAVFAECVGGAMPKEGVSKRVRQLHADYAAEQAKQAAAEKAAAEQRAREEQAKAAAENKAVQDAIVAKQAADQANDPQAIAKAAAELEAQQKAAIAATAKAEQAQRDADAKAKADKAAAEAAAKAAQKLLPKSEQTKPASGVTCTNCRGTVAEIRNGRCQPCHVRACPEIPWEQAATPKATAVAAATEQRPLPTKEEADAEGYTPEQAAAEAAELLVDSDAPDDAVECLLDVLVACKELSKPTIRALQAALVLLRRTEAPSPVEAAAALAAKDGTPAAAQPVNGTPATVAAA